MAIKPRDEDDDEAQLEEDPKGGGKKKRWVGVPMFPAPSSADGKPKKGEWAWIDEGVEPGYIRVSKSFDGRKKVCDFHLDPFTFTAEHIRKHWGRGTYIVELVSTADAGGNRRIFQRTINVEDGASDLPFPGPDWAESVVAPERAPAKPRRQRDDDEGDDDEGDDDEGDDDEGDDDEGDDDEGDRRERRQAPRDDRRAAPVHAETRRATRYDDARYDPRDDRRPVSRYDDARYDPRDDRRPPPPQDGGGGLGVIVQAATAFAPALLAFLQSRDEGERRRHEAELRREEARAEREREERKEEARRQEAREEARRQERREDAAREEARLAEARRADSARDERFVTLMADLNRRGETNAKNIAAAAAEVIGKAPGHDPVMSMRLEEMAAQLRSMQQRPGSRAEALAEAIAETRRNAALLGMNESAGGGEGKKQEIDWGSLAAKVAEAVGPQAMAMIFGILTGGRGAQGLPTPPHEVPQAPEPQPPQQEPVYMPQGPSQ